VERATAAIARFADLFDQHWLDGMRAKLGLFTREPDDRALVNDVLDWMREQSADFTNTFRLLTTGRLADGSTSADPKLDALHERLTARRGRQPQSPREVEALMRRHNPAFIPRNHKVEEALSAATCQADFSVMTRLLEVLTKPYDHDRDLPGFSQPGDNTRRYVTFCGT
jgi:uncharacterized protein YdiU (UPF0061 family)